MSLLRRREMMQEEKTEYAGILYIDSGFLSTQVRYDGTPIYNAQYPDAWATTYFPVQLNDVINCKELRPYNSDGRIRFYQPNGVQGGYVDAGVVNIQVTNEQFINARLMVLNSRASIPSQLTVIHTDGTVDTYKTIDRR